MGEFSIIYFVISGAVGFACLQATIIYLQMIGLAPSNHDSFTVTGTFTNPAPVGGFLAICASLALHQVIYSPKRFPWVAITCYLLPACVLTNSRAALLGLVVATIAVLLVKFRIPNKRLRRTIHIALLILGLLLITGLYLYRPKSADGRLLIWKICVKHLIADKPLFGHGMGGFQREYMMAQATYFASGCATEAEILLAADNTFAFNEFIRIACEYGIVGVVLVIFFLFVIIYRARKGFATIRGAFTISLVCGIVFACFSYPLAVPTLRVVYAMLIIGCMCPMNPMQLGKRKRYVLYACIGVVAIIIAGNRISYYVRYQCMDNALTKLLLSDDRANKSYIKNTIAGWADNERIVSRYAYVLYEKKQYKEAIPMQERSISLFPTAEKVLDLGDAYKDVQAYDKAIECYHIASNMLPAYVTPPYKLFCLYRELDMYACAKEYAERIKNMVPKVENKKTKNIKEEAEEFLRNHTKGQEERIFSYENGEQVWW